jgi:hypothetical protein
LNAMPDLYYGNPAMVEHTRALGAADSCPL